MIRRIIKFKRVYIPSYERIGVRVDEDGTCSPVSVLVKGHWEIQPVDEHNAEMMGSEIDRLLNEIDRLLKGNQA